MKSNKICIKEGLGSVHPYEETENTEPSVKMEQLGNDVLMHIGFFLETTCLFKYLSTCKYLWKLKDIPAFKSRLEEYQTVLQSFRHNDDKSWIVYVEKHLNIDAKTTIDYFRCNIEFMRKTNIDDQLVQRSCERCCVIQWNRGLESAVRYRNNELIQYFMELGADNWNRGMFAAAEGGHRDLVELFIEKGADDWNRGMNRAAFRGHRDLVEYFIEKGADEWSGGLETAAEGGHRDLMELFIEKGGDDWNRGMWKAADKDLVEFFIEKGADDWNGGMWKAAEAGDRDLVELFIKKGADDWNRVLETAAEGGHRDLVELFIEKGANDWNWAMYSAASGGHRDLVELLIKKGADDWNSGLERAVHGRHYDLVEFFIQKGASLQKALDNCSHDLELTKILFKQGRFKRETRDMVLKHIQDRFHCYPTASYQIIAVYCFLKQQNFTE